MDEPNEKENHLDLRHGVLVHLMRGACQFCDWPIVLTMPTENMELAERTAEETDPDATLIVGRFTDDLQYIEFTCPNPDCRQVQAMPVDRSVNVPSGDEPLPRDDPSKFAPPIDELGKDDGTD